jgi:hypothetical protein
MEHLSIISSSTVTRSPRSTFNMKDYTYSPLKDPKAQIRLVRLLPLTTTPEQHGSHQLELRCTLKSASLRDNPGYTALSYTWGTQGRTSRLIVKDDKGGPANCETAILITPSLEAALLNFRQPNKCITLWIDQLCINQDDISEKDLQVPLMRTIYEKARDVLVWLGPATDGSDHLLKILNEVGKQASQAGLLNATNRSLRWLAPSKCLCLNSLNQEAWAPDSRFRQKVCALL